ncbi:hypothetical protein KKG63_00665, partial [Patescibacteria group bacterium]|nr:hypothetical protein [Patescibacteria group bacterium]
MNITSLKFFKDRHIFILIILGLLPITWFRFGYLLRPEEVGYIDYSYLFEKFLFAWSEHSTNGSPVSYADHLALFPVGFLYKFFELIHVSPLAAQYIILIAYLETTLISMYLLVKHLIKDSL